MESLASRNHTKASSEGDELELGDDLLHDDHGVANDSFGPRAGEEQPAQLHGDQERVTYLVGAPGYIDTIVEVPIRSFDSLESFTRHVKEEWKSQRVADPNQMNPSLAHLYEMSDIDVVGLDPVANEVAIRDVKELRSVSQLKMILTPMTTRGREGSAAADQEGEYDDRASTTCAEQPMPFIAPAFRNDVAEAPVGATDVLWVEYHNERPVALPRSVLDFDTVEEIGVALTRAFAIATGRRQLPSCQVHVFDEDFAVFGHVTDVEDLHNARRIRMVPTAAEQQQLHATAVPARPPPLGVAAAAGSPRGAEGNAGAVRTSGVRLPPPQRGALPSPQQKHNPPPLQVDAGQGEPNRPWWEVAAAGAKDERKRDRRTRRDRSSDRSRSRGSSDSDARRRQRRYEEHHRHHRDHRHHREERHDRRTSRRDRSYSRSRSRSLDEDRERHHRGGHRDYREEEQHRRHQRPRELPPRRRVEYDEDVVARRGYLDVELRHLQNLDADRSREGSTTSEPFGDMTAMAANAITPLTAEMVLRAAADRAKGDIALQDRCYYCIPYRNLRLFAPPTEYPREFAPDEYIDGVVFCSSAGWFIITERLGLVHPTHRSFFLGSPFPLTPGLAVSCKVCPRTFVAYDVILRPDATGEMWHRFATFNVSVERDADDLGWIRCVGPHSQRLRLNPYYLSVSYRSERMFEAQRHVTEVDAIFIRIMGKNKTTRRLIAWAVDAHEYLGGARQPFRTPMELERMLRDMRTDKFVLFAASAHFRNFAELPQLPQDVVLQKAQQVHGPGIAAVQRAQAPALRDYDDGDDSNGDGYGDRDGTNRSTASDGAQGQHMYAYPQRAAHFELLDDFDDNAHEGSEDALLEDSPGVPMMEPPPQQQQPQPQQQRSFFGLLAPGSQNANAAAAPTSAPTHAAPHPAPSEQLGRPHHAAVALETIPSTMKEGFVYRFNRPNPANPKVWSARIVDQQGNEFIANSVNTNVLFTLRENPTLLSVGTAVYFEPPPEGLDSNIAAAVALRHCGATTSIANIPAMMKDRGMISAINARDGHFEVRCILTGATFSFRFDECLTNFVDLQLGDVVRFRGTIAANGAKVVRFVSFVERP